MNYFPQALDSAAQAALLAELRRVIGQAPLFTPTMPRSGKPMSVRMTNCGPLGWVTD
ncbi:MAG TPA: alpha-ketoglutarate-dependent dioxygenase AlkB, partial [Methyloceanibacter sp.]